MEVTPEMRKAVYELDCEEKGHIFDTNHIFSFDRAGESFVALPNIRVTDDSKLPVIGCTRCGNVWTVMPMQFGSYEQAEAQLYSRLKPDSDLAKIITRIQGVRNGQTQ